MIATAMFLGVHFILIHQLALHCNTRHELSSLWCTSGKAIPSEGNQYVTDRKSERLPGTRVEGGGYLFDLGVYTLSGGPLIPVLECAMQLP